MALSFVVSIGAIAQAGWHVDPEARRIMIGYSVHLPPGMPRLVEAAQSAGVSIS